jgi:glycerate kinase
VKKVVLAPQGFKGSLAGMEIAAAMERAVARVWPAATTVPVPVADGGDGTLRALVDASGGRIEVANVTDPLGRPVLAQWGVLGDGRTAVIEMARSSGLALLGEDERNPLLTTTYGVGELMLAALDEGYRHLIVGVGGSATVDGGAGMAQALGAALLSEDGEALGRGGGALSRLARVDPSGLDPRLAETTVEVACDVNNPLSGELGAAVVFGPQKGADEEMVRTLAHGLRRFARVVRRDLGREVADVPGGGAAGGLAAGLVAFAGAHLRSGADLVLGAVGLDAKLDEADLVLVGEGRMDRSTVYDKAPVAVARRAKQRGIPVVAVVGSTGEGFEAVRDHGIDAVFSLVDGATTLEEAMRRTASLVERVTERACRSMATAAE